MLLLCIKDMYDDEGRNRIFTSGKMYQANYGKYKNKLSQKEMEDFQKIILDYPFIKDLLELNIITTTTDNNENWIIYAFMTKEKYNPSVQFKNENFAQISNFHGGILR